MSVLYDSETKTSFRLERNAQGRLVINIKSSEVGPHITYNDAILYASGYASASAGGRLSGDGGVAGSSPGTGLGGAGYSGSGSAGGSSGGGSSGGAGNVVGKRVGPVFEVPKDVEVVYAEIRFRGEGGSSGSAGGSLSGSGGAGEGA